MKNRIRATVAGVLAIAAIVIATTVSLAGGSDGDGGGEPSISIPPEPGSVVHDVPGGGLGMCVAPTGPTGPDTPVCNDIITVPGGDVPDPGPQVVEPRPGMAGVRARPFDSATVADDDRTVTIEFVSGVEPCYVLDRVEVDYGADSVTITLFEGHDPTQPDAVCIEIGVFKAVVITLDQPLDGRTIVDGAAE
jgi:hypothetical protein